MTKTAIAVRSTLVAVLAFTLAIVLSAWINPAGAANNAPVVSEAYWLVPGAYHDSTAMPPAGAQSTFPQDRLSSLNAAPCGRWVQHDKYTADNIFLGDTLDWVNGHPEDSAIYGSHEFLWTGDCSGDKVSGEPVVTTETVKDSGCTIKHAPKPHPVHHTVTFTG